MHSALALCPYPLGKLTALPQAHKLDLKGLLVKEGKGREGRDGRVWERRVQEGTNGQLGTKINSFRLEVRG